MDLGPVSAWAGFGLSVVVILAGQAVLWTKFKTMVEDKVETHTKRLDTHDKCIADLKRQTITQEQHGKLQQGCRAEIFARIENQKSAVDDVKQDLREIRADVSETKHMVAQLIALQNGQVDQP